MKQTTSHGWVRNVAVAATLGGAAAAGAADQPDPAVAELTQPQSVVEASVGDVTHSSYKFGEYNGLQKSGVYGNGGFDVRGKDAYDSDSATRWRIRGTDLGLDVRSLTGEYGTQGLFRVTAGFDEILHNISDSYSTPYLGVGSSVLTLPANWVVPVVPRVSATAPNARGLSSAVADSSALVSGVLKNPTAAQLAASQALIAADLPAFGQHDLYTTRKRYAAGLDIMPSPKWEFAINGLHEDRNGNKPMGSISATTGGDISTILADPIDQTTDMISATLGYHNKGEFVQFAYNGSIFKNHVDSLTWTNWAQPSSTMTMSSAPSNQSHQLALSAGHDFSSTTRLVASGAYTRNTQNDSFLVDTSTPLVPRTSLDGLVVTEAFNLKLTSRPTKNLNLALAYKFDEHDNKTPVSIYGFYDANVAPGAAPINPAFATALGVAPALLASNVNINESRPYSRRLNQVNADADWKLTPTETLKGGLTYSELQRWCTGTWIDCMDADKTKEGTGNLELRSNPTQSLNTSLGYTFSKRTVDAYNADAFLALVPMANVSPTGALGGASAYSYLLASGLTGYGPVAGYAATTGNANLFFPLNNALANGEYQNQNRISEILGLLRYNSAPRTRNRARGTADWQAGEMLSLQGNLDYHVDTYGESTYGLLDDRDFAGTLEATFTPAANLGFSIFYTYEDQRSQSGGNSYTANSAAKAVNGFTAISGGCFPTIALRNASNKIDPCLNWETNMQNRTNVYGFSVDRKNLWKSKLDVGAQVTVTRAVDSNNVFGGNYVNNPLAVAGAPAGTVASTYIHTSPLPPVVDDVTELRLTARYAFNKISSLRLTYIFADMNSNDYAYQGYQLGGLAAQLPSGQVSPHYVVHVIVLAYAARF
jgi:MtrB/PioB family decaheme-associated outer membrane protein